MKTFVFPDNYEVYSIDQEQFFVTDPENAKLIEHELFHYQSYWNIPEDKEVECYGMDFEAGSNTYRINLEKRTKVKMNLLASLPIAMEVKK